jgi:drug/metabolite transporter (DMT)-like permease
VLLHIETLRFEERWVIGDLLTLANAASFSLFLVLSRDALRRLDPLRATMWLFVWGALGMALVGGPALVRVPFAALPARFWWLAAYAVGLATVVAYFLNYYALRHTDSSMVALFIYVQAPIATVLSMAYLHERPGARFWIAAAGIFLGVYLAVRGRPPAATPARDARTTPPRHAAIR